MDQDERKAFLEFFTGSDRVPIGGLGKLKPKIQSSGPDSDRLPTGKPKILIIMLVYFYLSPYLLQYTIIAVLRIARKVKR